jgi:tRNA-specific 2-thiouridylase
MRVAAKLGIDFKTLDLSDEYKKDVADYMISEYQAGRTPNPDVMCNKYIKFGAFFDWAIQNGADFVATGHYAQIQTDKKGAKLLTARDSSKDQSYFLWTLGQKQLPQTIFPIGTYKKSKVRKLAKKFSLPVATKKDSQGICFLGDVNLKDFLSHYIEEKKGDVLNMSGEVIGQHDGAMFLTIGQRHGFTITRKTPEDGRLFIVAKNLEKNTVTVSNQIKKNTNADARQIILKDVNWISVFKKGKYQCRFRYRQNLIPCEVLDEQTVLVEVGSVPEGQSLVVYDGDVCLGGGVI